MRVDGHAHLWDLAADQADRIPVRQAGVDDLFSHMARERVDRAVVVQPQVYGSDHRLLVHALERYPDRLAGFGLVDADRGKPEALAAEVYRLAELGLAGVRVHLVGGRGRESCAVARAVARVNLALELHVDEPAWPRVWPVIESARHSRILIDHLGRPEHPDTASARDFLRRLARYDTVAIKLSAFDVVSSDAFPHRDLRALVATAAETLGPERLLWGSNFPWCHDESYGASARTIAALGVLSGADHEAVMGATANRLLFAGSSEVAA